MNPRLDAGMNPARDVVPFLPCDHHIANEVGHIFVTCSQPASRPPKSCSRTEKRQVRILPSEVTRTRLQCPAEGMRHRRDNADLAEAIFEDVAPGGVAAHVTDLRVKGMNSAMRAGSRPV